MKRLTAAFLGFSFALFPQVLPKVWAAGTDLQKGSDPFTPRRGQTPTLRPAQSADQKETEARRKNPVLAGLEERLTAPSGFDRREFLKRGIAGMGAAGLGLAPLRHLLAQAERDPEKAALVARVRRMLNPDDYKDSVRFIDRQRITGQPPVMPINIPAEALERYRRVRGRDFRGFNFNGLHRSYRSDPDNPHWAGPEGSAQMAKFGRVWIYDSALGIKAEVGAAQAALADGRRDDALERFNLLWRSSRALVELGKDEEALGFSGGWHFSYNTDGDSWIDPRAPMGGVLWGINALYDAIGFVLTADDPAIRSHRQEALELLVWVDMLVKRLVFFMQVMDPDDPRDGLIRNMVYNSLIDAGLSMDDAGYRVYEGQPNRAGQFVIFEHNADLADVLRNAAKVNAAAALIDARFQSPKFQKGFMDELPVRHERLLNALWDKAWVGDHFVTAMEADGTINTSVALDNQTWVAGVFLPYSEDRVWRALDYAWEEFRTKGRDGRIATRLGDLVLEDVPAAGRRWVQQLADEEIAAVHFFDWNFKDPYVVVPAARRHKLIEMVQPEANEGIRDLLIRVALVTRDPQRREAALRRAELITKTLSMIRKIYGGLPYATNYIPDLMSTLQAMAPEASFATVSTRLMGAPVALIGTAAPDHFTFQGRRPGEAPATVTPMREPAVEPAVPAVEPAVPAVEPAVPAVPGKLSAKVLELKPAYMTLQLTVPERLKGKQFFAVAFIKTDQWYPQPSMRKSELMKRVRSSGEVTLTTVVPRSPFVGGGIRGRAVALFDSEEAFDAFLKDFSRAGDRATAQHAVQIFLISEEKQVTPTDRLSFHHPSINSPLLSRSTFRGPAVEVGPGSAALAAAQQPLSDTLLAEVLSPAPAGSMGNLPLAMGTSARLSEALLSGLEEAVGFSHTIQKNHLSLSQLTGRLEELITIAEDTINQSGFADALASGHGTVVLPPAEAGRLFGAPIALITQAGAPTSAPEALIFADTDLIGVNTTAFSPFATIPVGSTGDDILSALPEVRKGDLVVAQTDDLTQPQITAALNNTFAPGQAPRVIMAGLEDVQTLTVKAIVTLWTDPNLPDVMVIGVVLELKSRAGNTYLLIVAA